MIKRGLAILLFSFCLGAGSRQAVALDALSIGADAAARGGAYLAGSRSGHYGFQNYAFLAQQPAPRLSLTAFDLISEVNYFSAAYSQNNFSLGLLRVQESGGELRDKAGNLQGGEINYTDSTFYGAYGFALGRLSLGLRGKLQSKYFSEAEVSAVGLALDLAGAYQAQPYLLLGAELGNILATEMAWSNGLAENYGRSLGLGALFKVFGADGYWPDYKQPLHLYADIRALAVDYFWSAGAEYWLCDYIALRGGLKQARDAREEQSAKTLQFAAGVGFNFANFYFDYAYDSGDAVAENITHFFTISYWWDAPPPPETKTIKGVEGVSKAKKNTKKYKRTFRSTLNSSEQ
ncbi:hypothetical protein NO1_1351 [Candidatus Termititenax aidoneus]|uniref:Outer membrane protein n=1 Tax=Termititenax aidoneus TaxID=2218524 RepID=A0A388TCH7_TERA1|nr:hypothetical protein NO1_1351 [Candidatus Termititenax aidoneus]